MKFLQSLLVFHRSGGPNPPLGLIPVQAGWGDTMTRDEDYPSLRKALFGNGHVGNIYCACKWATWQVGHVFVVLLFLAFTAVIAPMMLGWRFLVWVNRRMNGFFSQMVFDGSEVNRGQDPKLRRFADTVKETPVARRVYNECPVDLKQDPRWFGSLEGWMFDGLDSLGPPGEVFVCNNCGDVQDRYTEPPRCWSCEEKGTFEEVLETRVETVHPDAEV